MLSQRLFRALTSLALSFSLGACGSILSSSEINVADDLLQRASEADADLVSIYEYVSAEAYLAKAREEWGQSDFQKSVEYARRAQEFAIQAYERALRQPHRATPISDPELDALDAIRN